MNEAVVTDYNLISPLGLSVDEFTTRMFNGESGIRALTEIVADGSFPVSCAGLLPKKFFPPIELNDFTGEIETQIRSLLRPFASDRFVPVDGLIYGSSHGPAKFSDIARFYRGEIPEAGHLSQNFGIGVILDELGKRGQPPLRPENVIGVANGCVTGLAAIHYAAQRVRLGRNRRILVICDEIRARPGDLLKYNALGALSRDKGPPEKVSRPFSKGRSGFVKGEGAGLLVIEDRRFAEQRNAAIAGLLLGEALTTDAWRLTDGREDLKGMRAAMGLALSRAGVRPEQIDYVNAHGTSTPNNDLLETIGIKEVLHAHAHRIPVSSLKSQVGHLNLACGIAEVIACLIMLRHQRVAPTLNFERDPECDLHYVPERSEEHSLDHILKNSFGFGGTNAAIVLKRVNTRNLG